jgi:hypothetical protein
MHEIVTTAREGVVVLKNGKGELVGLIYKDEKSRDNVIYGCSKMSMEEIELLFTKVKAL